jgi:hypothetical protein
MAKVALFISSLEGGGAERVMVTLANQFAEQGHQVDFFAEEQKLIQFDQFRGFVGLDTPLFHQAQNAQNLFSHRFPPLV